MSEVTIHLIRHAESLWNVERRYQGQGDSGLTAHGRAEASELARSLPKLVPHADIIFSSDLPRAFDTAAPSAKALGLDVRTDPRLREQDMGSWSGRRFAEMVELEPDLIAAFAAGEDVRRGGGETAAEMRIRVASALDDLVTSTSTLSNTPVALVFTHGGPIRVAVAELFGVPTPGISLVGGLLNCSVTTIRQLGPQWQLLRYNAPLVSTGG